MTTNNKRNIKAISTDINFRSPILIDYIYQTLNLNCYRYLSISFYSLLLSVNFFFAIYCPVLFICIQNVYFFLSKIIFTTDFKVSKSYRYLEVSIPI